FPVAGLPPVPPGSRLSEHREAAFALPLAVRGHSYKRDSAGRGLRFPRDLPLSPEHPTSVLVSARSGCFPTHWPLHESDWPHSDSAGGCCSPAIEAAAEAPVCSRTESPAAEPTAGPAAEIQRREPTV